MPTPTAPGDIVQNFSAQDQDGHTVALSDFAAQNIVLFFYPRADTPGCTIEACSFRDAISDIQATGAVVLGISRDTVKAQKKFAEKFHLKYQLLADPDRGDLRLLRRHQAQEHVRQAGQRRRAQHLPHRPRGRRRPPAPPPRLDQGQTRRPRRRSPRLPQAVVPTVGTSQISAARSPSPAPLSAKSPPPAPSARPACPRSPAPETSAPHPHAPSPQSPSPGSRPPHRDAPLAP